MCIVSRIKCSKIGSYIKLRYYTVAYSAIIKIQFIHICIYEKTKVSYLFRQFCLLRKLGDKTKQYVINETMIDRAQVKRIDEEIIDRGDGHMLPYASESYHFPLVDAAAVTSSHAKTAH